MFCEFALTPNRIDRGSNQLRGLCLQRHFADPEAENVRRWNNRDPLDPSYEQAEKSFPFIAPIHKLLVSQRIEPPPTPSLRWEEPE
jgi:hypothetical protein